MTTLALSGPGLDVGDLGPADFLVDRPVVGVHDRLPGVDHVLRAEGIAVVEGDALAQLERVGQRVRQRSRSSRRARG